jgi:DNA polymerase
MPECVFDIESRSAVNLHDHGAHIYAIDATTQPLCIVYAIDDGEPQLWLPSDPTPPPVFFDIAGNPTDWKVIAHNFDFERETYENNLVSRYAFPSIPRSVWHCTQRLAMANAYPAELGLLSQALSLPFRKDPEARKALLAVSRPRNQRKSKSAPVQPIFDEDPEKLRLVYERCKTDVLTTRAVWRSPKLRRLSKTERDYQIHDIEINARGIRLDRVFAAAAKGLAFDERMAINLKLWELTHGAVTSVDQTKRFLAAVNAHGIKMTSLNKRAVVEVLAGKPDDFVRKLLELRRDGARAAVSKFKRMLMYASPVDDRMRGTLRMYGGAPGRWSGLGPQLQNLKKNESGLPLSVVDSIRAGDRADIAKYGNPLSLLGDVSRAALCAALGMELMSGDFSAVESVVLAWLSGEQWKLVAYETFQKTGDKRLEPYQVIARRMLHRAEDAEINKAERQLGKAADLSAGFGGSIGAWRRIVPHDPRTDEEIYALILHWRRAHPATCKFWKDLARAIRVTIKSAQPILVAPSPQPRVVVSFTDGDLIMTLPSGRSITYPVARLVPGKFEDGPSDVEFYDNSKGQWRRSRAWFGTFVENLVQGVARDLLGAAIARFETRGVPVVFHCHDEVIVETPIGSLPVQEFREILLKLPAWAKGIPLGGKVHTGPRYLEEPEEPAEPLVEPNPDDVVVEEAVDFFIDDTRDDIGEIDDPVLVDREDDEDFVANLADNVAPLTELVSLALTPDHKVACPFHDDVEPSCAIYPDHFHCFGCGEHGSRVDWFCQVEGMTEAEAIAYIKNWPGAATPTVQHEESEPDKLAFGKAMWLSSQPLASSMAERYLDETRDIDVSRLPADIHRVLRFHPNCVFGPGTHLPCLIALMRDPITDAPVGVQRIALQHRDGKIEKIERRMLGHAGVVKLWPAGNQLVVGEGLETVLAAATRVPYRNALLQPAWAAMSSNLLAKLPVLPGVDRLIVLVDHDDAGHAAANACSECWTRAGRTVVRLTPDRQGADFNDLILERTS